MPPVSQGTRAFRILTLALLISSVFGRILLCKCFGLRPMLASKFLRPGVAYAFVTNAGVMSTSGQGQGASSETSHAVVRVSTYESVDRVVNRYA